MNILRKGVVVTFEHDDDFYVAGRVVGRAEVVQGAVGS